MNEYLISQIKKRIDEKSTNVASLERDAGLKIHAVRNILYGKSKKPSVEILHSIAKVLDCSIEELLGEPNESEAVRNLKDEIFSNFSLFKEVMFQSLDLIEQKSTPVESIKIGELMEIIQEIYFYSLKNNNGKCNSEFAEWYIDKYFN